MKFIVDAQLPKSLSDFLNSVGHDSIHTIEFKDKNKTTDSQIKKIASKENRIIITKDADFLESHLLSGNPAKLVIVKTGNIPNAELLNLFSKQIKIIIKAIKNSSLIEIHKGEIILHK